MRSPIVVALVAAALAVVAPSAVASERVDVNATSVRLAANARGTAMVTYHARGRTFHLLVWGAVNARPPSQTIRQVHFRFDWSGGWKSRHRLVWKIFKNTCAKYDGPPLVYLIDACKARDGSYWALQAWQPYLPHRGYPPWLPRQTQWELHVSHWTGPLAQLEAYTDWAFNGQAHDLFGRLQYLGNPVYGFGIGRNGAPNDRYGRSLYIDTLDSAYGAGWKRETSISFRRGSGAFCYSFWPTHDNTLPGYPDNPRPAGQGKRYRITVEGPGVTPDLQWEGAGLHDFNPSNRADVDYERRMDALFMQFLGSDKFCPTQR
jgi:type II secretory pathway pseudopilin PulG